MPKNFNPRTREGCDPTNTTSPFMAGVISIHAPVKGATHWAYSHFYSGYYFNPRTREGCDSKRTTTPLSVLVISIHAPVKGATS